MSFFSFSWKYKVLFLPVFMTLTCLYSIYIMVQAIDNAEMNLAVATNKSIKNSNVFRTVDEKIKKLNLENYSLVFFIPAIRINFYLKAFKKLLIDRNIFIAREMTKKYETYYRDSLDYFRLSMNFYC